MRHSGYGVRIGFEDELYIAGPRARAFFAEGSSALTRLRAAFPLVGRVYPEADVIAPRGTPLRLGVPRVRKWEIATRHAGRDGDEISPACQARLVTAIREFVIADAARTGHVAHYGPRPIRDVRDLLDPANGFHGPDAELLASVKRQVRSESFRAAVGRHFRNRASETVFRLLGEASPDLPAPDLSDLVGDIVYRDVDHRVVQRIGRALVRTLRERIEREWRDWAATAARIVRRIEGATSFAELCREPDAPIDPTMVPSCGVDINESVVHRGRSAFHDPRAHDQASALFHSVARASVVCLGRDSGSLLPLVQSYSRETFERLFRVDLNVPDRAGIGAKVRSLSA